MLLPMIRVVGYDLEYLISRKHNMFVIDDKLLFDLLHKRKTCDRIDELRGKIKNVLEHQFSHHNQYSSFHPQNQ